MRSHCNDVCSIVTPGPGAYVAPSAFGVYVGEKALMAEAGSALSKRSLSRGARSPSRENGGYDDVRRIIN